MNKAHNEALQLTSNTPFNSVLRSTEFNCYTNSGQIFLRKHVTMRSFGCLLRSRRTVESLDEKMKKTGRHGGSGISLLSNTEMKLQKKGIENMSHDELHEWVSICDRNEKTIKNNKSRRTWKVSKKKAEVKIMKLSS